MEQDLRDLRDPRVPLLPIEKRNEDRILDVMETSDTILVADQRHLHPVSPRTPRPRPILHQLDRACVVQGMAASREILDKAHQSICSMVDLSENLNRNVP